MDSKLPPPKPGVKVSVVQSHVRKTGELVFGLRYVDCQDKLQRLAVGTEAQAHAAAAKLQLESFGTQFLGQQERTPELSFAELREMQLGRAIGKDSLNHDESRWRTLLEHFGSTPAASSIAKLRPTSIDTFRRWFLRRPITKRKRNGAIEVTSKLPSHATLNRHLALLRSALNLAIEDGYISENPVKKSHFVEEKPRDRVATGDEMLRLCEYADDELRLAIVIAFETSLRQSSIVELTRSRVNIATRELYIPDTKNGDPITVAISSTAACELESFMAKHPGREQLFTVTPNSIGKAFKRLVRDLQIPQLRFHDLRHTAATRFARAGVDWKVIMRLGGWKSIASLMRYRHVNTTDLHAAVRQMEHAETRDTASSQLGT